MLICVYNIKGKFSCHCRGTTKTSWASGLKKHLFARILEQNKQTNKSTFSLCPKETDNCYLIPVDNKNSIFIPEKRKNRLNHLLKNASVKITNGLVPKERICVLSMSYYWYSVLSLSFSFAQSLCFCSSYRSSRHHVTLSALLKICQKLQYREKSGSKQIKNKHNYVYIPPMLDLNNCVATSVDHRYRNLSNWIETSKNAERKHPNHFPPEHEKRLTV